MAEWFKAAVLKTPMREHGVTRQNLGNQPKARVYRESVEARYARCGFVRAEHPGTKDGTVGKADYYEESFMIAMEEAGCWHLVEQMTKEQRAEVGAGIAGSVEHEGMAFYTPPASDRYNQIEREWAAKYRRLEAEFERYQDTAEKHMKRVLRVWPDTPVTISEEGVYRHDGRTTQIA